MTHASLFTGVGGFDLAASRMGWQKIFQCEIDPFCQKVLKHHFPQCALFTDIKTSKFDRYYGTIDVISGGFPCRPFSVAGKRKGTEDDRYLWPEMLRAIREVQPLRVVAENVGGILTMRSGVVFERVCADPEDAGYTVQPFVIPACAVGVLHRRDRVRIVAHAEGGGDTGASAKFRKTAVGQVGQMLSKFKFVDDIRQTFTHTDLVHAAGQGSGQEGCAAGTHQSERDVPNNPAESSVVTAVHCPPEPYFLFFY